ncbi:hypothetical protein [Salinibacterium xinjiangense]|uniref:hypothetical protein n=1 Tax=Salinibacterium xinjiangense TaxID=386302 RepID=UPI000BE35CB9|nr:hypothetical protein [Salinibacterium xinjiangense]
MTELFERGYLRDYFGKRLSLIRSSFESLSEDEVLSRSTEDLMQELTERARLEPLSISDDPIDGGVAEGSVQVRDHFDRAVRQPVFNVRAVYEFSGDEDLLYYQPSTSIAFTTIQADVGRGTLTVHATISASRANTGAEARRAFEDEIGMIRTNAAHSARDVAGFNNNVESLLRPAVERRKELLQQRRDLAGALGFPMKRRTDAPSKVPLQRRDIGTQRNASVAKGRTPYRDEPALTEAQYEDAIAVVESTLLAMERTPSVASGKDEEELRDQILVQLNGTFQGSATGETFIQAGKTDILVRVEDRHVFVGECKWWSGEKGLGEAVDQLLSYLPWRDEKAALIVFIDRKDASAVFEKAETAVKSHLSFKRAGKKSVDPMKRRNFVLGHPDDSEREIQLAVLFAVLPRESKR